MQNNLGHPARRSIARALKNDILHFRAPQMLDALFAQNPGNRIGNVALAAAVWANNGGYTFTGKDEVGVIREGLEARNFETSKLEHRCPSF